MQPSPVTINGSVAEPALALDMPAQITVDKLSHVWRYPPEAMHATLTKVREFMKTNPTGYYAPPSRLGAQLRLMMSLLTIGSERSGERADIRLCLKPSGIGPPLSYVRVEWNPAKAGCFATEHILEDLKLFLPATGADLLEHAYVTRIDLAVDVPGIRCAQLAAQRASNHKNAQIFVNAKGNVNSIRIGARGSSPTIGAFLRVYDKPLPDFANEMGVRAEIELSRTGFVATLNQIKNPFKKFRLYQFPPHLDGVFACFASAAREKGAKRALALFSNEKALAAELEATLDQCSAPWWDPDLLWPRTRKCIAEVFADHLSPTAFALFKQATDHSAPVKANALCN